MSGNASGRDGLGCSGVTVVSAQETDLMADLSRMEMAASSCSCSPSEEEKEEGGGKWTG